MKHFVCILLALLFSTASLFMTARAEEMNATSIMEKAWKGFAPETLKTEVETAEIGSSNWTSKKVSTRWIDYKKGNILFVLNRGSKLRKNPDGILFLKNNSSFGFSVSIQKRRRIKSKVGDFDARSNGTEFTYFDISRSIGENPNSLLYSVWYAGISEHLNGERIEYSIKATPREKMEEDYTHRVFHIVSIGKVLAIKGIEYFCGDRKEPCKVQVNKNLKLYLGLWRADKIIMHSKEGKTVVDVVKREMNEPISKLNKNALERGRP